MKKYILLFAALLCAGIARSQCVYMMDHTDEVTGDIIRAPKAELAEFVTEGMYKLSLGLIKEKNITERFVTVIFDFKIGAKRYPERCILPGEAKVVFSLKDGGKVEIPWNKEKRVCSILSLTAIFNFSDGDIAKLKKSPVTDFRLYYSAKFYEDVAISEGNENYFIKYLSCIE